MSIIHIYVEGKREIRRIQVCRTYILHDMSTRLYGSNDDNMVTHRYSVAVVKLLTTVLYYILSRNVKVLVQVYKCIQYVPEIQNDSYIISMAN